MRYQSDFLRTMSERGFLHQLSDAEGLDALMSRETVTAYIGFDATAASLHAGSMTQIMLLYWLQRTGHRPIALMGGGTTMIGDPSGRDETRQILTSEIIEANKASIRRSFENVLTFGDGPTDAVMADNADWLLDLNLVEFLRDYGRHFSVNAMLARDSVKNRLRREQHLSFLEFNYMVLQAYDFVELNRRHDCRLQMGGSDQWGNIVSGVDLGRRAGTPDLYALTSPLLATASGAKMGKTASGAVWLNPDMLPVFEFWQYCATSRTTTWAGSSSCLPRCRWTRWRGSTRSAAPRSTRPRRCSPPRRPRSSTGARRRSAPRARRRRRSARVGPRTTCRPSTCRAPSWPRASECSPCSCAQGWPPPNAEARRQVKGGALRIDGEPQSDERRTLTEADLTDGTLRLSMGRKRHVLVRAA